MALSLGENNHKILRGKYEPMAELKTLINDWIIAMAGKLKKG